MHKITLSVKELSETLGIGINQAYALVKRTDFPSIKVGGKYIVPCDEFKAWMKTHAYGEKE